MGYSSGFLTVVGASVRLDLKFEVLAWDIELLNRQVLRGLLHVEGPDIQRENIQRKFSPLISGNPRT
jgi:hypothetical protein